MPSLVIVDSYIIDSLKRKARAARLQACRASPTLEVQLKSLAELYESDIDRLGASKTQSAPDPEPPERAEEEFPRCLLRPAPGDG